MIAEVVFISLLLSCTDALPNGPPLAACRNLNPGGHPPSGLDTDLPYAITTDKDSFYPNEEIQITVSLGGESYFRGLMMQVRSGRSAEGEFLIGNSDSFRLIRCGGRSTVGHANRENKGQSTLTWRAPSRCGSGEYQVRATVVKEYSQYITGLRKTLRCMERTTIPQTLEGKEPATTPAPVPAATPDSVTTPRPVCIYRHLTQVPKGKYETSFEAIDDLNGWINNGFWRRRNGSTPTRRTGPRRAADGDYYMYLEADRPFSRVGTRAILQTDMDLRGCFCVKLKFSFNVRQPRFHRMLHRFTVSTGAPPFDFSAEETFRGWRELKLQMDTPEYVKIYLIAVRGRNNKGDTAVDDVEIEEGECDDTDDEDESDSGTDTDGEGDE